MNLPAVLVFTSLGLGASSAYLGYELYAERGRTQAEAALRQKQEAQVRELEAARNDLERQVQDLLGNGAGNGQGVVAAGPAGGPGKPHSSLQATNDDGDGIRRREGGGFRRGMDFMRNTLSTPEGRQAMKGRFEMSARSQYKDLARELRLSPEQASQMFDLMARQQLSRMEQMGKENAQAALEEQARADQTEMMALLGDKYQQYENYKNTLGERRQTQQLGEQFEAANIPLSGSQQSQVMQAMVSATSASPQPAWSASLSPQENIAQRQKWQEDYNSRVRQTLSGVLSAEQLKQYDEIQKVQSSMGGRGLARMLPGAGVTVVRP